MKIKTLLLLILLGGVLIGACGGGSENITPSAGLDLAPATPTTFAASGPVHSVATCTAQSEKDPDYTVEYDWIINPENYSVTIIEYGDYQ